MTSQLSVRHSHNLVVAFVLGIAALGVVSSAYLDDPCAIAIEQVAFENLAYLAVVVGPLGERKQRHLNEDR